MANTVTVLVPHTYQTDKFYTCQLAGKNYSVKFNSELSGFNSIRQEPVSITVIGEAEDVVSLKDTITNLGIQRLSVDHVTIVEDTNVYIQESRDRLLEQCKDLMRSGQVFSQVRLVQYDHNTIKEVGAFQVLVDIV
jgi:hypothetical protein